MRALLAAVVLLLGVGASSGAELQSISSILAAEDSDATTQFALKRCSAIYVLLASFMKADGNDELSAEASDSSTTFFTMVMLHAKKRGIEIDGDAATKTIMDMARIYTDYAQDNYLKTGNRIEGVLKEDTSWCASVLASLKG